MRNSQPYNPSFFKGLLKSPSFSFIKKIEKQFPSSEIYLVGGAVRDTLLKRKTKDYDFVVRGVPLKKLECFLKRIGTVNFVGKAFGVLKFSPLKKYGRKTITEAFDIALPRSESYTEKSTGHYRDVAVQTNYRLPIEDDLSRRDFTINALAYDSKTNHIIDPFGGLHDLEQKIVRTVGTPVDRFREDYSRMLRAIRFACQLDFHIDARTTIEIRNGMKNINKHTKKLRVRGGSDENEFRIVPLETIAKEFIRAFTAHPTKAFDLCDSLGVFEQLMPEVLSMKGCPQPMEWHSEGDVWTHTRLSLEMLSGNEFRKQFKTRTVESTLILTTLLHDIGKPATLKTPERDGVDRIRFDGHDRVGAEIAQSILERLRTSSVPHYAVDPQKVTWLIHYHLILLNSNIEAMKNNTIEKYFFKDKKLGDLLQKLIFTDSCASLRADGESSLDTFCAFQKRLKQFGTRSSKKLPKPLINGHDVMNTLSLKPGKRVGAYLQKVREEQLAKRIRTKNGALSFLRKT